jgi:hypothetical protein
VGRRAVSGQLQGGAQRQGTVGLELDGPAAQGLDALQDAQGLWAKVFHEADYRWRVAAALHRTDAGRRMPSIHRHRPGA